MLTEENVNRLRMAGFYDFEIEDMAKDVQPEGAQSQPDLDGPSWQSVMKTRSEWTIDKVDRGWLPYEIEEVIRRHYERNPESSIWSFLKAEYRPVKRVDYLEARAKRERAKIEGGLHGIPTYFMGRRTQK